MYIRFRVQATFSLRDGQFSSHWPLTYVCTIGLFKAAAAARRRLFNESLYGVCPIGVPEALLTSCEKVFSGERIVIPTALEVTLSETIRDVLYVGYIIQAWSSWHGFGD